MLDNLGKPKNIKLIAETKELIRIVKGKDRHYENRYYERH